VGSATGGAPRCKSVLPIEAVSLVFLLFEDLNVSLLSGFVIWSVKRNRFAWKLLGVSRQQPLGIWLLFEDSIPFKSHHLKSMI
jgi:hypothetical protein